MAAYSKGRVERAIRYIRTAFFEGRPYKDIDDLNAQADAWVVGASSQRPCPEDTKLTVQEAFEQEKSHLMELPATPFSCDELRGVSAGKTPYVRFDLNDYSIPHTHVQRSLTASADLSVVRILDGQQVLATHRRCWDKGGQIEVQAHMEKLVQHKRAARNSTLLLRHTGYLCAAIHTLTGHLSPHTCQPRLLFAR